MRRQALPALALVLAVAAAAGCLGTGEPDGEAASAPGDGVGVPADPVPVVAEDGSRVRFAQAAFLSADGETLAARSLGPDGLLDPQGIPADAAELAVTAPGHGTWRGPVADLPAEIVLPPREEPPDPDDGAPVLSFLEPLTLGTAHLADQEETCRVYNCGASEPVIEVAGDGTIYVSGTCCIGEPPPIWYSTDGGDTWSRLEGDVLRDVWGIEGDFAVDEAGNLYFADISVASAYLASWDADQEHRHTVPAGPFAPIVDRPWVRAGARDHVYFAYNRGSDTAFYASDDGGLTWTPRHVFEEGLGNLGQGPEDDHLWMAAGGTLYESTDAGVTWSDGEDIPEPEEDGSRFMPWSVPVADAAGNVWVAYDWVTSSGSGEPEDTSVHRARRAPDGNWSGPWEVSPEAGTHHLPWPAAGDGGKVGLAWYGTLDDEAGPNSVSGNATWRVYAAVTLDGGAGDPAFAVQPADPDPVHEGPMDRKLLDFLQAEVGPDGALHVAYAADPEGRPDEVTRYVRTTTGLDLAPPTYFNGPIDAAGAQG